MINRFPREDYTMLAPQRKLNAPWQTVHIDATVTDLSVRIALEYIWRDRLWVEVVNQDGRREMICEDGAVYALDDDGRPQGYWGRPSPVVQITTIEAEALRRTNTEGRRRLATATRHARQEAERRYPIVLAAVSHGVKSATLLHHTGTSTLYKWRRAYIAAQDAYGHGYVGLLSHHYRGGNQRRSIPAETEQLMDYYLRESLTMRGTPSLAWIHKAFVAACKAAALPHASLASFYRRARLLC